MGLRGRQLRWRRRRWLVPPRRLRCLSLFLPLTSSLPPFTSPPLPPYLFYSPAPPPLPLTSLQWLPLPPPYPYPYFYLYPLTPHGLTCHVVRANDERDGTGF